MSTRTVELPKVRLDPITLKGASHPVSRPRVADALLYPLLVVGATTAVAHFIHRQVNVTVLPLVVVAVMICTWKWGLLGGIWGMVLAWFGYLFFFIPPILTFYIRDEESAARMAELVVTSAITLCLTVGLDRSRQRFRSEHHHLHEVLRQLPSGVLIANAQSGQIVLVNDQVEKIWDRPVPGRMTVKDYVGWEGFHLPEGRPYEPSERPLVRALSRGEVVMGEEYEILRRDGSRATIQVNAGPLTNSAGTVVEGVVIFQDVTPRRRAEDGLRFLARSGVAMSTSLELDSVLTSLAKVAVPELGSWCSIYMAEGEGDNLRLRRAASTSINPANAILLEHIENRYPPDQGDPQGVAEVMRSGKAVLHPELPEGALAAMAQSPEHLEILRQLSIRSWMGVPLVVRGRTQGVMVLATTGHDRRYEPRDLDLAEALSLRAALAIENARLYREAEREIEARKLAEEEVRNLNAHLEGRVKERTAELEETVKRLDSFAYSVAHDFRAPLRGVSGLGLILIQEYAGRTLDAEALDYLHRMTACAQKMDTLISDLLSYSRVTRASVQIESVETDSLVVGVVEQLKELLRERKASVNVRRDLPPVMGHHQMLAHAVSNLLTNAVKFVAPGIQPKVDIWAEPRGDSVRLWIQDNGIGIEPDYHDRIFGIFQRLNPLDIYPGTGIGLAIARAAIERIGGRVGVESNLGEGSRFWIELPKVRPAG